MNRPPPPTHPMSEALSAWILSPAMPTTGKATSRAVTMTLYPMMVVGQVLRMTRWWPGACLLMAGRATDYCFHLRRHQV